MLFAPMNQASNTPDTFGAWVRKRRKLLDLTQDALALNASLSASAVRKIESDERRPSRETAELLAEALQVGAAEREQFLRLARSSEDARSFAPVNAPESVQQLRAGVAALVSAPADLADLTDLTDLVVANVTHRPVPHPAQPIVGRAQEIAQIDMLLADPECRLLTIVGAGGMGKTRLALEVARRQIASSERPVVWVELSPLASSDYLPAAVAAALGLATASQTDPAEVVLEYLARRPVLLVLDSMEHLLAGAEYLSELLARTSELKVVVTSREHLNLLGEWVFEIQGLAVRAAVPSLREGRAPQGEGAAAMLFAQRAQQADVTFVLDDARRAAIDRICVLLGGMPLAIELAASWVRVLSPHEIEEEIVRSLDFLAANRRDLPARHRSMRAVFDQSWSLLSEREQRTLRRVSLFRGSFARETVRDVADGSLAEISALVAKSLLYHGAGDQVGGASGRYRVHELVRQFAEENLRAAGEVETTLAKMLAWYIGYCERGYSQATGDQYVRWIETLLSEIDNLRFVLEWGFAHEPLPALRLFCALRLLWEQRSADEVSAWMTRAITLCETTPDVPDEIHARVLGMAAWVDRDHRQAAQRARTAIELARKSNNDRLVASVLPLLGHAAIRENRPAEAPPFFDEAIEIAVRLENPALEASVRNEVGKADRYFGNYARARAHHERALAQARRAGQPAMQADAVLNLNLLAMRTGDFSQAQAWIEENLALARATGDRVAYGWSLQSQVRCFVLMGEYERATTLLRQLGEFIDETPYRNQPENYQLLVGDLNLLQNRLEESEKAYLACLRTAQDPFYRGWSMRCLGVIERFRGNLEASGAWLNQAIALSEATNERWNLGLTYIIKGDVAQEEQDFPMAWEFMEMAANALGPLGDKWGIARWCESAARLALEHNRPDRSALYMGAADSLRERTGARRSIIESGRNQDVRVRLVETLGQERFAQLAREGALLSENIDVLLAVNPYPFPVPRRAGDLALR